MDTDVGVWDPLRLVLLELKEKGAGGGGRGSQQDTRGRHLQARRGRGECFGAGGKEGPAHQLRVLAVNPVADVGGPGAVVDPEGEAGGSLVRRNNPPEKCDLKGKRRSQRSSERGSKCDLHWSDGEDLYGKEGEEEYSRSPSRRSFSRC